MAESEFTAVAPLDGGHDRTPFDCGVPALNLYLRNYALQNQKKGIVRNYVTTRAESKVVVAYYSLVYAAIDQKRLPAKLVKGLGKYDIPVMLLARLAVDHREQGKGLGKALLKDAILRTIQAAEIAGRQQDRPPRRDGRHRVQRDRRTRCGRRLEGRAAQARGLDP